MKIFLDDQMNEPKMPNRRVPEGFVGVRDFEEFRQVLEEALASGEKIEALSFDNDLGDGKKEGWEIAKWLTEVHPEIFEGIGELKVHSENRGGGRKSIESYFEDGRVHWKELIEAKSRPHPWGEMERRI
ncbi:MAG TPA: cyclic-phosphate processing receiver domain-containing protein [Candidatus Paceibacterota bacterium]